MNALGGDATAGKVEVNALSHPLPCKQLETLLFHTNTAFGSKKLKKMNAWSLLI